MSIQRIVLVDDDPTLGPLLKTLLEMDGYAVTVVDQGSESELLSKIDADRPDLVLLDVHLKQADGVNLLKHLRQNPQLNQVRVIMVSGMDVSGQCLRAGADAFLMKPYMPDDLIALIRGLEKQGPAARH